MYPIEYRWISVPTPVTKRIIVTESGSTRKPIFTTKPPDWNHVQSVRTCSRCSASRPRSTAKATTEQTNDRPIVAVAIQPARGSPMRLPNSRSTTAPKAGSAGISQTRSRTR